MIGRLVGFALAQRFHGLSFRTRAAVRRPLRVPHLGRGCLSRSLSPMIEVIRNTQAGQARPDGAGDYAAHRDSVAGDAGTDGNPFAVDLRVERYQSLLRFPAPIVSAIDRKFSTGFNSPCCRRTCSRPFRPGPPSPKSSAMNSPATMCPLTDLKTTQDWQIGVSSNGARRDRCVPMAVRPGISCRVRSGQLT